MHADSGMFRRLGYTCVFLPGWIKRVTQREEFCFIQYS